MSHFDDISTVRLKNSTTLLLLAYAASILTFQRLRAVELQITSFCKTNLAWTSGVAYPYYHVELATNLNGPWHPYRETQATNCLLTLPDSFEAPVFIRLVASSNSWFYNGIAATWTGNTNLALRSVNTNGDTLTALTELGANGQVQRVTGAVWQHANGPQFIVHTGADGLPSRAVIQDHVFLFANYTSNTVDIAHIDANESIEITRRVLANSAAIQSTLEFQGKLLIGISQVLEATSLVISAVDCLYDLHKGDYFAAGLGAVDVGLNSFLLASADNHPYLEGTALFLGGVECWHGLSTGDGLLDCTSVAIDGTSVGMKLSGDLLLARANSIQVANQALTTQPPIIITNPISQTITAGGTVTFSVTAIGQGSLGWRWFRGSTPLSDGAGYSGTHSPTLNISSVNTGHVGVYAVVVTNLGGSATSSSATLKVRVKIADSQSDFSGTQGYKGWYYGYGLGSWDSAPGGFSQLPVYTSAAGRWSFSTNWPTIEDYNWTSLVNWGCHPDVFYDGENYEYFWAGRKWICPTSAVYEVQTTVTDADLSIGDGVIAQLGVAGISHTFDIPNGGSESYSAITSITSGSELILFVGPRGYDWADSTSTRIIIYRIYQ